ncbi:MAG: undecaprenyldiphospho-muramoylpentapeptide beta-N-acetylglucosaminyltransferase [Gammaproteobacteria bacterium]
MTRALIAAGGTGGHVFPALAIAEELQQRGAEVFWLAAGGMETALAAARGFPVHLAPFRPPRGIGGALRLAAAVWRARRILRRVRPAVVLGMGGYAAAPGGLAAKTAGVPVVVHEQNAVAGRANRLLCKIADQTLTGFPGVLPNGRWVGNPVRAEFFAAVRPQTSGPLRRLLVLGGSQGARALNETVPAALARLPADFAVFHQCGRGNLDAARRAYQAAGRRAEVCEFMDDVAAQMAAADLILSRAGAATLAEIAATGGAALLIPYPFAAGGHQRRNAEFFAEKGAAFHREEEELTAEWLADFLAQTTRPMLAETGRKARELARPNAAADVAEACLAEANHAA